VDIERTVYSCTVSGHAVGVESFAPVPAPSALPLLALLHGRDGPDGVAGDRGYSDLARAVAEGGFRVLLPRYFDRTRDCEPDDEGDALGRIGREVEQYGLWLEAIGAVLREGRVAGQSVGLLGYSLGGYLALTAAMAWREVAAVAVCYAGFPTTFTALAGGLPPTLVLHGGKDRVVPREEVAVLAGLLRTHRVAHEVHLYPDAGHGFCGADAEDAVSRVVEFFRRRLNGKGR
jgi:dienelactone hydrolase